jgi:hypothetical protein
MPLNQAPIPPILPGDSGLSVRSRLNEAFARLIAAIAQINLLADAGDNADLALVLARVGQLENDVADLLTRMTATETAVSAAEADITVLDARLTTAEGDITVLDTRVTNIENTYVARSPRVVTVPGTAYTLVAADMAGDTVIVCTSASATTVTVAPSLPPGTVSVYRQGTGAVTLAPGIGVTLNSASGLGLRAQHSAASLVRIDAAEIYFAAGDLSA